MTISGMTSYTLSKPWKKNKIEIFNLLSTKLYVGKNQKVGQNWTNGKFDKIENWMKLKLDEIENWMRLKFGWNWKRDKIKNSTILKNGQKSTEHKIVSRKNRKLDKVEWKKLKS